MLAIFSILLFSSAGMSHLLAVQFQIVVRVVDQSPNARPLNGVTVFLLDYRGWFLGAATTDSRGEAVFAVSPGTYTVVFYHFVSLYGMEAAAVAEKVKVSQTVTVTDRSVLVNLEVPLFDATIELVTVGGAPIAGAHVRVSGIIVGYTGEDGRLTVPGIPRGTYLVFAQLRELDVSPDSPLVVVGSGVYRLAASGISRFGLIFTTQVGQRLQGARVILERGSVTVFSGNTDSQGEIATYLPSGTYDLTISYKGIETRKSLSITTDIEERISVGFIELFGQVFTLMGFLIWMVILLPIVTVAAYLLLRKKKPPPPPPTLVRCTLTQKSASTRPRPSSA